MYVNDDNIDADTLIEFELLYQIHMNEFNCIRRIDVDGELPLHIWMHNEGISLSEHSMDSVMLHCYHVYSSSLAVGFTFSPNTSNTSMWYAGSGGVTRRCSDMVYFR